MELSRSDFQILNVLKEHQCTNYQESMTLQEIIPELPFSRVTAYKRLKNLCDMGYTAHLLHPGKRHSCSGHKRHNRVGVVICWCNVYAMPRYIKVNMKI